MTFDVKLKKRREKYHMSQTELANAVGVTLRTIQNWETGGRHPRKEEHILKLSEVLGVDKSYWSDNSDQEENSTISQIDDPIAKKYINGISSLFAGGRLSDDDKDLVLKALIDCYWEAKEINKKYAPKKNRHEKDE